MKDLLESLSEQYPLLAVVDPAIEIRDVEDWTPVQIPEGIFEPVTEFIVRYVFVSGETHKGAIGYQLEQNSMQVMFLRNKIEVLLKRQSCTFTMPFYGFTALIVIDWEAKYISEIIQFSFINTIKPTDQEVAVV